MGLYFEIPPFLKLACVFRIEPLHLFTCKTVYNTHSSCYKPFIDNEGTL